MSSVPAHCYAAGAVALGATVVATQLHTDSKIPSHCVAASIAGSTTLAAALAHHGSTTSSPAWYCIVGGVGGVGGIAYSLMVRDIQDWPSHDDLPSPFTSPLPSRAVQAHSEKSKVPLSCKLYTLGGIALIIGGAAALAKSR
mmetsp:Transcript_31053/g.84965  ORF Transcript_31053/g.84965 Transcript_31053/m.84965 type:complete len:142 (-) Transcript_31053:275-700(-)